MTAACTEAAVIDKQNNALNLNLTTSWVGAVVPTTNDVARWRSIVTSANTADIGTNQTWAGIAISNPGGNVTITSATPYVLSLGGAGVDMSGSTRDLKLSCTIQLREAQAWNVGAGRLLTLAGALSGSNNLTLIKTGSGTLVLNETNNTFAGLLVVSNGLLSGTGVVSGPVLIAPGGTLSPGNPVGQLTVCNALTVQGGVRMEITKGAGALACDSVVGLSSVTYGGTLWVSNTSASALVEGDSVRLFAAAAYSGMFTNLSLPTLSSWLTWDSSRLGIDGTIRVVAAGPPYIVTQPTDQLSRLGQGAAFYVGAGGRQPLTYRWWKDGSPLTSAASASLALTNLQSGDAGNYQVVISNAFGSVTSQVAVLNVNLATLAPLQTMADGEVFAMAVQADGKTLLAGDFGRLGGQVHARLGRLNVDGSVDSGFNAEADGPVYCVVPQADGKILVAGAMSQLCGQRRAGIGRLNADGSLDPSFTPNPDSSVYSVAVQADGRIVVAGSFGSIGGQNCPYIARLNPDGSADTNFNLGANNYVYSVALQPDGKILAGGSVWPFSVLGGRSCANLGRLNTDGTLDTNFVSSAGSYVFSIAVQPDGKIIVGGGFGSLGGQARGYLGRLYPNGSLDASFTPQLNGYVNSVALQADGRILIGGRFTTVQQQACSYLARLNPDGSLDQTFRPAVDNFVNSTVVRPDGGILVGGKFSWVEAQARAGFACLNPTEPPFAALAVDGSAVRWLRAGSAPELSRVAFDYSTNSLDWVPLGEGSRISGGWEWAGLSFPTNGNIRARGSVSSGYLNGSRWYLEQIIGPPVITTQPAGLSNNPGATATLRVIAGGSEPLSYQWRKDGVALTDDGRLSGSQTSTLSVSNAWREDSGAYSVVVTNSCGSVTSLLASLRVMDPGIVSQPSAQSLRRGENTSFSVESVGTAPLSYQWLKDGVALPGMTAPSLSVTNAQAADAGMYSVLVSNAFGTVVSAGAVLTVDAAAVDFFNPNANGTVHVLAEQPDGKLLVGGSFTQVGGQSRTNLARLNKDGTLDATFNPGPNGYVFAMAVMPDGKLLVGGLFSSIGTQNRTNVACLDANGNVDSSFTLAPGDSVYHLLPLPDGKVLMSGYFFSINGQSRPPLVRLNSDGSLDTNFVLTAGLGSGVQALARLPDGRILAGGDFATYAPRNHLIRFLPNGSFDTAFQTVADSRVSCFAVQADGKILVGGDFSMLGGQPRACIGRLNADGSLDTTFNPGANNAVASMVVQADGKIVVGGGFTKLGGCSRNYIARLNADGTVDETFNPGADNAVQAVIAQADGKILAGGYFASLGGQTRNHIGRLDSATPVAESLAFDSSSVTWLRSGCGPELERVTIELSTNGVDWFGLQQASRVSGGWQATGLDIPAKVSVRARGCYSGGYQSGSVGLVESIAGLPLVLSQPVRMTNGAGTTVSLAAQPRGSAPFSYQWLRNGTLLTDQGNISGAQTPVITLTNLTGHQTGEYSLAISNGFGWVTNLVGTLTVLDPRITTQPLNTYAHAGESPVLTAAAAGALPMTWQWFKEGAPLVGATAQFLTLTNAQPAARGRYYVTASNEFGTTFSSEAELSVDLATVDSSFNPGVNGTVYATAVQPDGKVLVGGLFNLVSETVNQPKLARFNTDGTLDTSFRPALNATVNAIAVLPDGRIVVGGSFTSVSGQGRANLCRLNGNGTLDESFTANVNGEVYSLGLQADNKLIVAGTFTSVAGQARSRIARLNANGTLDTNFTATANSTVYSLGIQPDGGILVGGNFTTLNGLTRTNLGRLNQDGTVDTNFVFGANGAIYAVALQADGKILAGGNFTTLAAANRSALGRLNRDGSLDATFSSAAGGTVYCLALQADGKILVGGNLSSLAGGLRSCLGRLNADGSLDEDWRPPANSTVYSLALQEDSRILVGGAFTNLGGQACAFFGRVTNTVDAADSLAFDGTNVTWLRSGGCPEISRAAFELSTNGSGWVDLGAGARTPGGWSVSGAMIPSHATIRARGFTSAGRYGGSAGLVEQTTGPALVTSAPFNQTNNAGTDASFTACAAGSPPFSYQWFRDGVPLHDDGSTRSGTQTAVLSLVNLLSCDAGEYSVVISNATGCSTGTVVRLTVFDPVITLQPVSQATDAGQLVVLAVTVAGSQPMSYQWFRDDAPVSGATTNSLVFAHAQASDSGSYRVVVTNAFGCRTSSVALLQVNVALADPVNHNVVGPVYCALPQVDGKIVVAGEFTGLGGLVCSNLGRLSPGGSPEELFRPEPDGIVKAAIIQPDGRTVVGGDFARLANARRGSLGRIGPEGTLDAEFDPPTDGVVNALLLEPDGKLLVAGAFSQLGGQRCVNLGRLTAGGELEVAFAGATSSISCLARQADSRVIIGGSFTVLGGQAHANVGRLNADGSWDSTFAPDTDGSVLAALIQPDGKILLGGLFTKVCGQYRSRLARLNADGSLDAAFNAGVSGPVNSLALQADGKLVVGGSFTTAGGQARNRLARFHPDGSLDFSFNPSADGTVNSLAIAPGGMLLVGGAFAALGGQPHFGVGRLSTSEAAAEQLGFEGSTITWRRSGASAEAAYTWFEMMTNGASAWTPLGTGTRIPGGWTLTNAALPGGTAVRARGLVSGGWNNGSQYFVESTATVPFLPSEPPVFLTGDGTFGISSNLFQCHVRTGAGQVVVLQTSTNLLDWTSLRTQQADSLGVVLFSEPVSLTSPCRFYRVWVSPLR